MPGRLIPLITNQVYHVFNRGIDHRPTFINKSEYDRAIDTINFYHYAQLPMRFSKFLKLSIKDKEKTMKEIRTHNKLVEIFIYCLMPNHFHIMVKQLKENGISKFMSNFQNSYTRYFNIRKNRDGSLFLDQFKAVRIETDEQFLHVSRYIHLNPLTSYLTKDFRDLKKYPWSSLNEYLNNKALICQTSEILNFFGKRNRQNKYLDFIEDNVNYQRELNLIEHLIFE